MFGLGLPFRLKFDKADTAPAIAAAIRRQGIARYVERAPADPAIAGLAAETQPNIPSATRISTNRTRTQLMKKVSTQARMNAENQPS